MRKEGLHSVAFIVHRHRSLPYLYHPPARSSKHPHLLVAPFRTSTSPTQLNRHLALSAGVSDWDLVVLGPGAVLQEDATVSAAQLNPGGVIALQRVVINALVKTGAHVPAGVHISRAVPPLTCDAPSKKVSVQCEEDDSCAHHERRPLLAWLMAMCARGLGAALCDAALLALALAAYLSLDLPTSGSSIYSIVRELILIAPLWKVLLFATGALGITAILRPLAFAAWLVGVRRVFVPLVADGDCASHGVGSIFLELALRSKEVHLIDGLCGFVERTWVARAFGVRVAARGFLPLPKLDRPELVSIGENSYTGGGNTLCTRHADATGAIYRQIRIGCDSFIANGSILMPGTSFGPHSVLGNRSLAIGGEDYGNAVFAGQQGTRKNMLSDMSSGVQQLVDSRASPVRLWKRTSLKPSEQPFQAQNEGFGFAMLLLGLLCIILLQMIELLILLAVIVPRRLLGLNIVGIAAPLMFVLVCAPWLRLLWYLGATWLCKRFLVGPFREDNMPAKIGSRTEKGREIFVFLLSFLDGAADPLKGSAIYNAIQRALGAKVGPGVCWLGQQSMSRWLTTLLRTGPLLLATGAHSNYRFRISLPT